MAGNATGVTQDEFESLHDGDGHLKEQDADTEDSEPEEEADETEESEEPEDGDEAEEEEINWEEVDPRVKAAYDKAESESKKWLKAHGKIQSDWTKQSQAQKEFESTRARLEQRDQLLAKFEEMLENNPKLVELIQREQTRKSNPFADEDVPDYLQQDPAFKHMQQKFVPYIQRLEQELQGLKQKTSKIDEYEAEKTQAQNKAKLDKDLADAGGKIKAIFGREATEDEITEVLQYMVDHKFYGNGAAAALAVYGDQYEQAVLARHQASMKEKAKKFPSRTKSVSGNGATQKHATSNAEAITRALAEHGF